MSADVIQANREVIRRVLMINDRLAQGGLSAEDIATLRKERAAYEALHVDMSAPVPRKEYLV